MLETYGKLLVRLLLTAVLFAICFLWGTKEVFSPGAYAQPSLILDAGHGGEDGGTVGIDGTIESDINLSIALKAAELSRFLGWNTYMTREADISIHDQTANTLREKKVSDLKNRVKICNQFENGILISIHQNALPGSPKTKGAQVFYNEQEGSAELAYAIQKVFNDTLNLDTPKDARRIGSSSYLMKNVSCRAVLIECGFLTNLEETVLLNNDSYQMKISLRIISAISEHLSN